MGHSATVWNFQLLMSSKPSKLSLHSLLKNIVESAYFGPKYKCSFLQILPYIQSAAILVSQGLTS